MNERTVVSVNIDPPSGWRYGFPSTISLEIFNNVDLLKEHLLFKGYPKDQVDFALKYLRVWYNYEKAEVD